MGKTKSTDTVVRIDKAIRTFISMTPPSMNRATRRQIARQQSKKRK